MCMFICGCVYLKAGAHRGQKKSANLGELEIWAVVRHPTEVLKLLCRSGKCPWPLSPRIHFAVVAITVNFRSS